MLNTYLIKFIEIDEHGIEYPGEFRVEDCPSEEMAKQLLYEQYYDEDEVECGIVSIEIVPKGETNHAT